ncbi:uncharacterized protein DS421_3g77960 [Arachis hypogaea]|nr:uncharacterized protein DS421_3g77960 [Arachis hypogaea]
MHPPQSSFRPFLFLLFVLPFLPPPMPMMLPPTTLRLPCLHSPSLACNTIEDVFHLVDMLFFLPCSSFSLFVFPILPPPMLVMLAAAGDFVTSDSATCSVFIRCL